MRRINITKCSILPGGILAVVLSWATNKSVLWCLMHWICGWFYVVYWAFRYGNLEQHIKNWITP